MGIPRQLPNAITIARIPLAAVFLVLLLIAGTYGVPRVELRWIAAILFIIAISTDWVDGYLARKYEIVSDFGKLWDPIADKLLTGCGFIGLAILGEVNWWIVAIILVREWGITVHRLMIVNEYVVAAAWMGKVKTVVQAVALSWALLPLHVMIGLGPWTIITAVLMIAALVLTVASGLDYIAAHVRGQRRKS